MLVLRNLSYSIDNKDILNELFLSVNLSKCIIIKGPNGSGKTTLLRLINGSMKPSKGNIIINNQKISNIINYICYCDNNFQMDDDLTVYENLYFWNQFYGNFIDIEYIMHFLKINHLKKIRFKYLSMGQKKRVSLCRLPISSSIIWLLDEPTVGLDKLSIDLLQKLINNHLNNNGIAIISTHQKINLSNSYYIQI